MHIIEQSVFGLFVSGELYRWKIDVNISSSQRDFNWLQDQTWRLWKSIKSRSHHMSRRWKKELSRERSSEKERSEVWSKCESDKKETISTKTHQHFLEVFLQREELKCVRLQRCVSIIHWAKGWCQTKTKKNHYHTSYNNSTRWNSPRHASWDNQNTKQWQDAQILLFWSIKYINLILRKIWGWMWLKWWLFHFTSIMRKWLFFQLVKSD